jgi:hypothetical protein
MDNQLENEVSMYIKTETMLNNNVAATSSIALIATEKAIFSAKLAELLDKAGLAGLDITGNTVEKQEKRQALTQTTITVSRAITLHAHVINDKGLLEKYDLSLSNLNAMRDSEFYVQSQITRDTATTLAASLVPYGISAGVLTQFGTELTDYYSVIQKPKDQISNQSIVRKEIDVLVFEIRTILKTKLDIAMSLFQFSNPSLYSLYQNARSIDDTSSPTLPDYEGTVPAGVILSVANIPYIAGRSFKLKNTGTEMLQLSLSATPGTMEGAIISAPAGGETPFTLSSALNSDVNANFLNVQNTGIAMGNYQIFINE